MVPFTTNDILPYMRQAAGIIAEEAGANSHSAIVGLTLGKPVIIGATHATRTLKDGMKISMDCARGVVQAMSGIRRKNMERIASFCVDHNTLVPGMYLSRKDGDVLTWDIRMKTPNKGSYLSPACAHTIEHLFATYARNSKWSEHVI